MKQRVSVTLDARIVKLARAMGLNLSYELNVALAELVRGPRTPAMVRIYFLEREVHGLKQRLRELVERRYGQVGNNRERRAGPRPPGITTRGHAFRSPRLPARPRQEVKS